MESFRFHPSHRKLILCDLAHICMSLLHDPSFGNRKLNRTLFALCGMTPAEQLAKPGEMEREEAARGSRRGLSGLNDYCATSQTPSRAARG